MKHGVDISAYQGTVDFDTLKNKVDFVIIRVGYGKNHLDSMFKRNIAEAHRVGIPYGFYWFSYALSPEDAINEADYLCDAIKYYEPSYPLCFDYEYDSYNYALRNHTNPTESDIVKIATAFLNRIEERGYYAMNYTNIDFLSRGFKQLVSRFDTWLAQWAVDKPSKDCGIWQYTSHHKVGGISGFVDADYAYKDYPTLCKLVRDRYFEKEGKLNKVVNEILCGEWGNGEERKQRLIKAGYNYDVVQNLVNKKIIACNNVAHEVIDGLWGNGEERKLRLEEAGYPYSFIQSLVNAYMQG